MAFAAAFGLIPGNWKSKEEHINRLRNHRPMLLLGGAVLIADCLLRVLGYM
ncbi:MAG: hypothetical protein HQK83_06835 [Fibrobacteria bacterium]|nr:hypothetical protein [Fibrobacteria bacterium]